MKRYFFLFLIAFVIQPFSPLVADGASTVPLDIRFASENSEDPKTDEEMKTLCHEKAEREINSFLAVLDDSDKKNLQLECKSIIVNGEYYYKGENLNYTNPSRNYRFTYYFDCKEREEYEKLTLLVIDRCKRFLKNKFDADSYELLGCNQIKEEFLEQKVDKTHIPTGKEISCKKRRIEG